MRKNIMMRVASVLLVAVLLSTCAISGTFAKYTTQTDGSDNARVAKFGVTGTIVGDAFAKTYDLEDTVEGEFTLAVESSTEDKLVAPGTTGTFTGINFEGKPEVAVRITTTATVTLGDNWKDASGNYYCPLEITINETTFKGNDYDSATAFATAVKGAIEAQNGDYAPNTDLATITGLNGDYTWTWAFTGNDDVKDTYLGDQAAAGSAATVSIAVQTVVEQIN